MISPTYPVNEFFPSLLEEGRFAGTPVALLRLQGCPIQCAWCHTKFSWSTDSEDQTNWEDCLAKPAPSLRWSQATAELILQTAQRFPSPLKTLYITGGEPALYDLRPLSLAFEQAGWGVVIETSAMEPLQCSGKSWVIASPKLSTRSGKTVLPEVIQRANEIRLPIARETDLKRFEPLLELLPKAAESAPLISLQPVSQNPRIVPFCQEIALKRGWKLSISPPFSREGPFETSDPSETE